MFRMSRFVRNVYSRQKLWNKIDYKNCTSRWSLTHRSILEQYYDQFYANHLVALRVPRNGQISVKHDTLIAVTCFGSYLAILELYKIVQRENAELYNVTKN
jgi:hypothetical protein